MTTYGNSICAVYILNFCLGGGEGGNGGLGDWGRSTGGKFVRASVSSESISSNVPLFAGEENFGSRALFFLFGASRNFESFYDLDRKNRFVTGSHAQKKVDYKDE